MVFIVLGILMIRYFIASKPVAEPRIATEKIVSVRAQTLTAERLSPELSLQGEVEAAQSYLAAAPSIAWVQTITVKEGDTVVKGQVLLTLDARDFVASLTQSEADVADMVAQRMEAEIRHTQNKEALVEEKRLLTLSKKAYNRTQRLKKQALSSESALDEAMKSLTSQKLLVNKRELEVNSFNARMQQLMAREKRAQAQLQIAERALERSHVIAPYAGIIENVNVSPGARVNAGEVLLTLVSPEQLEIRALLPALYQAEISDAIAAKVLLTAFSSNTNQTYILRRLSGKASIGGIDAIFGLKPPSITALRSGDLINLTLKRPGQDKLFRVPSAAIYDNSRIYLLRDGRLQGVEINNIGQLQKKDRVDRLIQSNHINTGDQLVLTRLPNAVTGLKVSVISDD